MSEPFSQAKPIYKSQGEPARPERVLITGAAGRLGSYFAEQNQGRYEMRLMVANEQQRQKLDPSLGEVVVAKLEDQDALKRYCEGMDAVIHLAASANPSGTWSTILPNNIEGTYNLYVAARAGGVGRVIFASTIHTVSGYGPDVQIKPDEPINPGDLYGVSKCFGEAMGRYMAEQENLSVLCVRIGACQRMDRARREDSVWMLDAFISYRDLNQLFQRCLDHPTLRFGIFHGLSDNRFKRMDISNAREVLGYQPQDDITEINPQLSQLDLVGVVRAHDQGDSGQRSGIREHL